jgi:hypothetical protein
MSAPREGRGQPSKTAGAVGGRSGRGDAHGPVDEAAQ